MSDTLQNLIPTAIVLGIIAFLLPKRKGRKALIREKKAAYDEALKSGSKEEALRAGLAYYVALRCGTITIHDEHAITDDLATMEDL